MNTPWTLEEQAVWPFDLTIKDANNEVQFSVGRCAYSSTHDSLDDVYVGRGMGKNQAEAVKCNAEQKAMLDGIVRAVNAHDALVSALEAIVAQDGHLLAVNRSPPMDDARDALKLAKGEA